MRAYFTMTLATLALAVVLAAPVQAEEVRIGWTAWPDAEFVTKLAGRILEDRLDHEVELVKADIAAQYRKLADGDIDLMLMAWLPSTHEDYMNSVGDDVVNLGVLYGHARLGWAVPAYVPEEALSSVSDLADEEIREHLGGKITGIDPGAGLTRLSKHAIEEYGLDGYELELSSSADMTTALNDAIDEGAWIVVTGWSPHWKFGAHQLRYLDDPRSALGASERVHALARHGFYQQHPEAALMIARMHLDLDELQQAMFQAREDTVEAAVERFIADNQRLIDYWVSGQLD